MNRIFIILILILFISHSINAQNGIIKGRVSNAINNEPLPFVNIIVNETTLGTTSDIDGNFIIKGIEPGFVQLTASFIGFKPVVSREILVSNAKAAFVNLEMEQVEEQIEEVIVKASPFKKSEESPVSLRSIGLAEIERNPGSNRDISRVIQSFPGVGGSVAYRNDVIIRGGGPSESRFYLDGVEVPNINHFATQGASGGPVGILNADFIRQVDYYSGAFPANRSNALSGVLEFSQIDGNPDKLKFRGAIGASEISGTLDGPVGEKTTFIASARQSYLQFLFDAIGLPFLPTFNDFQFKSRTRINKYNELTIIGLGAVGFNRLNTGIKNPDEEQSVILSSLPESSQWTYTLGAVYKHFQEKSYTTLVVSRNHLNNVSYKYKENDDSNEANKILDYESQEIENKIRLEVTSRSGNYKINYGVNTQLATYTNQTFQKRFIGQNLIDINYETDLNVFKYGAFGQISREFFNTRLVLSTGARIDGNNYSASMSNPIKQFSPRFSASYYLSDKISVNFNTGRYFQLPAYTTLGFKENGKLVNKDNDLRYISTNHIIGGFEFRPLDYIQITLEGFYKHYNHYPFSLKDSMSLANKGADFGVVGDEAVRSESKGRAYGFELLARLKNHNGYNINLAYTYVRSEFDNAFGNYAPSSWDSKHLLTLTGTKSLKNNWNVGFKWRFVGGLPYTPYDIEKSSVIEAWDSQGQPFFDFSQLNAKRLDIFHQLDVRIDKGWFFPKWSLMLYLDIQNFYNYKAKQQDYLIRQIDENGNYITTENDTKYVFRRISNTAGTVLPTIGIMVEF